MAPRRPTRRGTTKALNAGLGPLGFCALGLISGIGGRVVRDVLLREVPLVLRREIYALAALAGAAAICLCHQVGVPQPTAQVGSATLVFALRMISVSRNWSAPIARPASLAAPGSGWQPQAP